MRFMEQTVSGRRRQSSARRAPEARVVDGVAAYAIVDELGVGDEVELVLAGASVGRISASDIF